MSKQPEIIGGAAAGSGGKLTPSVRGEVNVISLTPLPSPPQQNNP